MHRDLLLSIVNCPAVTEARRSSAHPCRRVVMTQLADGRSDTTCHVPEPWSGNLESAPILFIGTNPSINYEENFPDTGWDDETVVDFFQNRFGGGSRTWAAGGRAPGLEADERREPIRRGRKF